MALYRAKLVSFDAGTYTATVRMDGGAPLAVTNVTVSRACPSADLTAGRKLIIDTGDHGHLADCVVLAVYA